MAAPSSESTECSSTTSMLERLAHFDRTCALLLPVASPLETLQRTLLREQRRLARSLHRSSACTYITDVQRDGMTASWRQKMARWMFETGAAFGMAKDTVGCAVAYMDQYLSVHSVTKQRLQMLALVTLSMASKMHETQPISLDEMLTLSENKFSTAELWRVEAEVASVMEWRLDPVTSFTLARDLAAALEVQSNHDLLSAVAKLLQDIAEDYASLRYRAGSIAVAAVFATAKCQGIDMKRSLAVVLSSLDMSAELVECFYFVLALRRVSTSVCSAADAVAVAEVKDDGDGVLVAASPCSVEADLSASDRRSTVWATELCALLGRPLRNRRAHDLEIDSGDDCSRWQKRARTA